MTTHPYLQHGLSILRAQIQTSPSHAPFPTAATALPFVTLSHETCAGATTLGHALVPLLNEHFGSEDSSWMLLEKDLINQALSLHHLPEHLAAYLPEDRLSETKGLIGEMVGLHPPLWELEHRVAEAIQKFAKLGCVIMSGRAAHLITRELPGGLHIRLVAPLATRIRRAQRSLGFTPDAARQYVLENDQARERHLQTQFEQHANDPLLYDLVINTGHTSPETAARLTLQALIGRRESPPTEDQGANRS
jgi:hypothetical protein